MQYLFSDTVQKSLVLEINGIYLYCNETVMCIKIKKQTKDICIEEYVFIAHINVKKFQENIQ